MERRYFKPGTKVKIKKNIECDYKELSVDKEFRLAGKEFVVEGYWDELTGASPVDTYFDKMPIACYNYLMRTSPTDNFMEDGNEHEVLYGKIGIYGHLIHVSELEV